MCVCEPKHYKVENTTEKQDFSKINPETFSDHYVDFALRHELPPVNGTGYEFFFLSDFSTTLMFTPHKTLQL